MFTRKHYINIISLIVISLISLVFVIKFSLYSGKNFYLVITAFLILFYFIIISLDQTEFIKFPFINDKFLFTLLVIIVIILFFIIFSNPSVQRAEKLLTIRSWLARLFDGRLLYDKDYYFLPVYYFLAFPFVELGAVALVNVAAILLYSLFLYQNSGSIKEKIIKVFLLLLSPLTFYAVIEAGGFFLVVTLILFLILFIEEFIEHENNRLLFITGALIAGLLLSTIPEVLIPIVLITVYFFKSNMRKGIAFLTFTIIFFIMTLIPFYIYDKNSLTNLLFNNLNFFNNIFSVFSFILFAVVILFTGWLIADFQELFFACGLLLFLPFAVSFLYLSAQTGFIRSLTISFDTSYFFLSLPFFIASIKEYKVDHFLGKIIETGKS